MASARSPFIVIEGLDRSGKPYGCTKNWESGYQAGPDKISCTAIGKMTDSYLRPATELDDHAIHLLFSANRWEMARIIEDHVKNGTIVVSDRYAYSGIAFSASKVGSDGQLILPFGWCLGPDVDLPAVDIILYFGITPEKAEERGGYGEERYEKKETRARVRHHFQIIGKEMQDAQEKGIGRWVNVDAGRGADIVAEYVCTIVGPLITSGVISNAPRLWISE